MDITILGIESSCDDTSAAVLRNNVLLSNVIASQAVHVKYGGVIPELASRAHQQNIIPVVDTALKEAGVAADRIDAIAFTRGPGLVGSLLVGVSFTKGLSIARNIPMVEVNHLQGHILSHFIDLRDRTLPHPDFPFLCLLVSGGHTQIVRVDSPLEMEIIGTTIDDAAGEAFDKCAKVMGLPYPGGPVIDRLAKEGDPKAFRFAHPRVEGYDYSFSGLKTSFLYTLRDARLFLFQAHPHPAACIAGPQRVGDEVEQQLFGLIGDPHDGAVLDAPAPRRERYFQRPLDVRGQTARLFQQTAQVQRLQLAQLFIFQLIKCYGIAYRAVQPGRLYLDV